MCAAWQLAAHAQASPTIKKRKDFEPSLRRNSTDIPPQESVRSPFVLLPLTGFLWRLLEIQLDKKNKFVSIRNTCHCHIHANPGGGMLPAQIL
jgi:hypothetical protein